MQQQPLCIYLHFAGATWQIGDLDPGVYPMEPRSRTWLVNEQTKVKARRTGFHIIPDLSATAHMLQGATLEAVIADCLEHGHTTKLVDMLAAYVGLSRAKIKENVLIMQAFSPALFNHGPPPGPHILMRLLRGDITEEDVDEEFKRLQAEAVARGTEKGLMRMVRERTVHLMQDGWVE